MYIKFNKKKNIIILKNKLIIYYLQSNSNQQVLYNIYILQFLSKIKYNILLYDYVPIYFDNQYIMS